MVLANSAVGQIIKHHVIRDNVLTKFANGTKFREVENVGTVHRILELLRMENIVNILSAILIKLSDQMHHAWIVHQDKNQMILNLGVSVMEVKYKKNRKKHQGKNAHPIKLLHP
jgi:hypothetical protein